MIGIYKITNLLNQKCYIGQSINIKQRWKQHRANSQVRDEALYLAIQKYGIENFSFEVIEECKEEELDLKEQYYINYYDSYNNGYNMTLGGQNNKDFFSEKIFKLWDEGKNISEISSILNLSRGTIHKRLKDYINYSVSESKSRGGRLHYKVQLDKNTLPDHMKPKHIYQYDIWGNQIRCWDSASQISSILKIDKSLIGKAIRGEYLQAGGYQWKIEENAEDISNSINLKFGIIQKDFNNNVINKFNSLKDIEIYLGKKPTSVNKCLKDKQKTAYGFLWEYDFSIWDGKPYQKGELK